jgi:aminoglycoside phosphotransferase (APT) family kinase protein
MHGDFHMFNALIAAEPPGKVTAIIDWETATIGDPLLDLIGFCEIWGKATAGPGWPRRAELIARYREQRDLELPSDLSCSTTSAWQYCLKASTSGRCTTRHDQTWWMSVTGRWVFFSAP